MRLQLMNRLRRLVAFELEILPEDIGIAGSFDSGDPEYDKALVKELTERLNSGDQFAWFCAKVTASCAGFSASTYLGTCSYKNEEEFRADGYYEDLKEEAFNLLCAKLYEHRGEILAAAEHLKKRMKERT